MWPNYEDNEINEKTKYWVDLWEETIVGFSREVYDKELVNPHLLLINLLEEIKFNKLMNIKNNKYFLNKLNSFVKDDKVIKNLFKTDFLLLISELSQKSRRLEYFAILCERIIKYFQQGVYFKESCDQLKKIVLDNQWKDSDKEEILLISQNLIIELILAGYSLETIKTIPRNLFDKYQIREDNEVPILITKYPISTDIKDFYDGDQLDNVSYHEAMKAEIDSLSISNRIEKLKYYFDKEPIEGYGIFHIEGLKGDIDVNIGEVNFYSPKIENYWRSINNPNLRAKDFNEMKLEFYDDEESYSNYTYKKNSLIDFKPKVKKASFINAAVKIKYRDFDSARKKALEIVEKSLDILRLHTNSKLPFKVKLQRFYLVDCDDLSISDSYSTRDTPSYKEIMSYDLNKSILFSGKYEEYLNELKKLLFNEDIEKDPLSAKLVYSLHWYRKAFETDLPEDKLLNYWIAIENLLTFDSKNGNIVLRDNKEEDKFLIVQELVPFIELNHSTGNVAVNTYLYLKNLIYSSRDVILMNSTTKPLDVPQNCLEDCQLKPQIGKKDIDLRKFIQTLPLLYPYVKRKIIEDRIRFSEKFYNDTIFKSEELERRLEQVSQDLLLIYRYRNLIVHNARFDTKILPYYVMKAENLAGNLISKILYEHAMDSTKSHQEILISERVKMEMIMEKLKSNTPVDFWEL
ncbi:hypothetical protein [Methanosarcina siciliae]|uniref:hypothetical protein n=1 Tax=Methanosarcina siciliae TaxID=38027 RepID=UPI0011E58EAC|nr:hypothetical protein [Methanosarcina siciliae]